LVDGAQLNALIDVPHGGHVARTAPDVTAAPGSSAPGWCGSWPRGRGPPPADSPLPIRRRVDAVLRQLQLEVLAVHAHVLRGLRDVAVMAGQGLVDELALEALDRLLLRFAEGAGRIGGPVGGRVAHRGRQVAERDLGPRRQR